MGSARLNTGGPSTVEWNFLGPKFRSGHHPQPVRSRGQRHLVHHGCRRHRSRRGPIELGAEFIHGSAPESQEIARKAALATVDISGRRWQIFGERLRPADDFRDRLDRVMRRLDNRRTPDRSFEAFLSKRPGGRRGPHRDRPWRHRHRPPRRDRG